MSTKTKKGEFEDLITTLDANEDALVWEWDDEEMQLSATCPITGSAYILKPETAVLTITVEEMEEEDEDMYED